MTKHSGDQKQTVSSSLESASQITEWLITGNGGLFEAKKNNVWKKHKRLEGKRAFFHMLETFGWPAPLLHNHCIVLCVSSHCL